MAATEEETVFLPSELTVNKKRSIGDISDESGSTPAFPPRSADQAGRIEYRKLIVPQHRMPPFREKWLEIYEPIVSLLKLQIRMNPKTRVIELKTSSQTTDVGAIQKAADFIKAFILGFAVNDAIALVRLDDLFIDSFQVNDVKMLHGDNLSRAIGRIAGKDGKTRFTIENATRTRIVIADSHIHILGSFNNIKIARDCICSLILGSPPGKVYAKLQTISTKLAERF